MTSRARHTIFNDCLTTSFIQGNCRPRQAMNACSAAKFDLRLFAVGATYRRASSAVLQLNNSAGALCKTSTASSQLPTAHAYRVTDWRTTWRFPACSSAYRPSKT